MHDARGSASAPAYEFQAKGAVLTWSPKANESAGCTALDVNKPCTFVLSFLHVQIKRPFSMPLTS